MGHSLGEATQKGSVEACDVSSVCAETPRAEFQEAAESSSTGHESEDIC